MHSTAVGNGSVDVFDRGLPHKFTYLAAYVREYVKLRTWHTKHDVFRNETT